MPFTDDDRQMLVETHTNSTHLMTSRDDHETRIRRIEKKQWTLAGGIAALGGIGTLFLDSVFRK